MTTARTITSKTLKSGAAQRLDGLSPSARRLLQEAAGQIDRNDLAAAQRTLTAALALAFDHVEAVRLEGVLLQRQGRLAEAVLRLTRASALQPHDALILANLGAAQFASQDFPSARSSLQRACELDPTCAPAWFELAKLLDTQGFTDEARVAFERFLDLQPDHLLARVGLAGTLKALGRIDQAALEYRRVIARNKHTYQAWFSLVDLKTVALDAREVAELERLAGDALFPPTARAALAFAHGKVCEDAGRQTDAFAAFQQANATMRASSAWNARAFSRGVDAVITAFDGIAEPAQTSLGADVVFIVSLPRSGSTLFEQILAAHPQVEGASELPDLSVVLGEESTRRGMGFPQWIATATDADWQRLGQRYLERTARWRTRRPRFTDKMPSNWHTLGAALRMLPGAHVVDCRRDTLETCWSCYKQLFAPGRADYTYSFSDLAAHSHDYERLMEFWRARHAEHIQTHSYEALVADAPGEIRRLLAFCDLPFDPACLEFHRADRSTRTASAAQVRQPLQRDTTRTAAYGQLLDPLRHALHREPAP